MAKFIIYKGLIFGGIFVANILLNICYFMFFINCFIPDDELVAMATDLILPYKESFYVFLQLRDNRVTG